MTEKEIDELYRHISSHFDVVPSEAKEFFFMFVQETLTYRDELVSKGEKPLTVDEVQEALNLLENVLLNKQPPKDVPPRLDILISRWIAKLNEPKV